MSIVDLINSSLAEKYRIMQQQADADTQRAAGGMLTAQSGANLDNVRAGLLPKESAANVAQTQAQTKSILENNKYIGPLARSNIGLQGTQGKENIANAGYIGSEATGNTLLNTGFSSGSFLEKLKALLGSQ